MQDAPYLPADLHRQIQVDCIYTVHYFEYTKHYRYAGEAHDFWECVYVDRGEVIATAGTENITLGRGEILFHPPNEWHTLRANGVVAPNLVVLSFASRSSLMESFRGRHMRPGNRGRALISAILRESESVFVTPLGGYNDLYQYFSITSSSAEKKAYAEEFIDYVLSDGVQAEISRLGMFSPYRELSFSAEGLENLQKERHARGISAFLPAQTYAEFSSLSRRAAEGDGAALKKIENLLA